jgi:hypothetical protein
MIENQDIRPTGYRPLGEPLTVRDLYLEPSAEWCGAGRKWWPP